LGQFGPRPDALGIDGIASLPARSWICDIERARTRRGRAGNRPLGSVSEDFDCASPALGR
jgi:hypothetical protein